MNANLDTYCRCGTGASTLVSTHSPYASILFWWQLGQKYRALHEKGEDAGVPALIAVNPGEAVLVAAFEEPFDDFFLDVTDEPATRLQLGRMPGVTPSSRTWAHGEHSHHRANF